MSIWQIIGTVSLLITLMGGVGILLRNPIDSSSSISYYIASKRRYFIIIGLVLTFAGLAFYGFLMFWLIPTYNLPVVTYWIVIGSFIAQLFVAWLPAYPHTTQGRIHAGAGVAVGTAMVICIWILALFGQNLAPLSRALVTIAAFTTPITYVTLSIGLLQIRQLVLPSEVIMISVFSLSLLAVCWQI